MADTRDEPHTGGRFLVAIDEHDGRDAAAGFAEVVFPPFGHHRERQPPPDGDGRDAGAATRCHRTARSLHWWDAARRERTPPTRTVTVQLLGDDQRWS